MNTQTEHQIERYNEFLWGFAKGADIDRCKAKEEWNYISWQLSDQERERIEQTGGQDGGYEEGIRYRQIRKENDTL